MQVGLVDGYNFAFRAFYGMPELRRADGFPTGALHGWVRTLWWIEDQFSPDRLIVFFDLGGGQRQLAIRDDYKANRKETPEELARQMPVIKAWTRAAGYVGLERDGVEADDLLATYARHYARLGDTVHIYSADKDLAQLVGDGIFQCLPPPTSNAAAGWRRLDASGVREKFGIRPDQIADYLALVGDSADNIPGLTGVGPKTAAKWLQQYGSLAGVIAHSGELNPKRFQQLVYQNQERLLANLQMTQLDDAQPLFAESAFEPPQIDLAIEILQDMEMQTTAAKLRLRTQSG